MPIEKRGIDTCYIETYKLLEMQDWACAFSSGMSRYCWNGKQNEEDFIVLRWGHKTPRGSKSACHFRDYFLLCERCNNQLQTSRTLKQLRSELEHKLHAIRELCA